MKTLMSLAKKLDFKAEYEYFDYCIDSYLNGQFEQCKNLFKDMTKADRKELCKYIFENHYQEPKIYFFYFNLI